MAAWTSYLRASTAVKAIAAETSCSEVQANRGQGAADFLFRQGALDPPPELQSVEFQADGVTLVCGHLAETEEASRSCP